jgi:hypothetical protein
MLKVKLARLPEADVQRILILRTARTPQVQWALEQLRAQYPSAGYAVLGTGLQNNILFDGMRKFEVQSAWLKPDAFREFEREIRDHHFDLVVMILNGDGATGYEDVSRIMKKIPAGLKLVSGYNRRWYRWNHSAFSSGSFPLRWICTALECLLFPFVHAYMFTRSSRPAYMPSGQERRAPGYER